MKIKNQYFKKLIKKIFLLNYIIIQSRLTLEILKRASYSIFFFIITKVKSLFFILNFIQNLKKAHVIFIQASNHLTLISATLIQCVAFLLDCHKFFSFLIYKEFFFYYYYLSQCLKTSEIKKYSYIHFAHVVICTPSARFVNILLKLS